MRKLFIFVAVVLLVQSALISKPLNMTVSAQAAILMNAENGKILFAKNEHEKLSPASVTKIATCLTALKKKPNFAEVVKCHQECLITIPQKTKAERKYEDPPYRLEPDGKGDGIYTGEYLTLKDLFHGMMLASGNDSSNVLAYHLSNGDIPAYMHEVNEYLASIGCKNTQFYNPHGLHYPKHLTTAYDLALLAREAIKDPEFMNIIQKVSYERPKTNKQPARTIWATNRLLRKGSYYYPKAFGIKVGYHAVAGFNFVGAAKDQDRVLISVVLHCENAAAGYGDTIKMFNIAFAEKKLTRQLLNHRESVFKTKVKGAKGLLKASLEEDLVVHYFPSEEEELKPSLHWYDLKLPVKKGERVGEIQLKEDKKLIKTIYLYAMEDLNPLSKVFFWIIGLGFLFLVGGLALFKVAKVSLAKKQVKQL